MKTMLLLLLSSTLPLEASLEKPKSNLTIVDAAAFTVKEFWETPAGKAFWDTPEGKTVLKMMLEYQHRIEDQK